MSHISGAGGGNARLNMEDVERSLAGVAPNKRVKLTRDGTRLEPVSFAGKVWTAVRHNASRQQENLAAKTALRELFTNDGQVTDDGRELPPDLRDDLRGPDLTAGRVLQLFQEFPRASAPPPDDPSDASVPLADEDFDEKKTPTPRASTPPQYEIHDEDVGGSDENRTPLNEPSAPPAYESLDEDAGGSDEREVPLNEPSAPPEHEIPDEVPGRLESLERFKGQLERQGYSQELVDYVLKEFPALSQGESELTNDITTDIRQRAKNIQAFEAVLKKFDERPVDQSEVHGLLSLRYPGYETGKVSYDKTVEKVITRELPAQLKAVGTYKKLLGEGWTRTLDVLYSEPATAAVFRAFVEKAEGAGRSCDLFLAATAAAPLKGRPFNRAFDAMREEYREDSVRLLSADLHNKMQRAQTEEDKKKVCHRIHNSNVMKMEELFSNFNRFILTLVDEPSGPDIDTRFGPTISTADARPSAPVWDDENDAVRPAPRPSFPQRNDGPPPEYRLPRFPTPPHSSGPTGRIGPTTTTWTAEGPASRPGAPVRDDKNNDAVRPAPRPSSPQRNDGPPPEYRPPRFPTPPHSSGPTGRIGPTTTTWTADGPASRPGAPGWNDKNDAVSNDGIDDEGPTLVQAEYEETSDIAEHDRVSVHEDDAASSDGIDDEGPTLVQAEYEEISDVAERDQIFVQDGDDSEDDLVPRSERYTAFAPSTESVEPAADSAQIGQDQASDTEDDDGLVPRRERFETFDPSKDPVEREG